MVQSRAGAPPGAKCHTNAPVVSLTLVAGFSSERGGMWKSGWKQAVLASLSPKGLRGFESLPLRHTVCNCRFFSELSANICQNARIPDISRPGERLENEFQVRCSRNNAHSLRRRTVRSLLGMAAVAWHVPNWAPFRPRRHRFCNMSASERIQDSEIAVESENP